MCGDIKREMSNVGMERVLGVRWGSNVGIVLHDNLFDINVCNDNNDYNIKICRQIFRNFFEVEITY